MEGQLWERLYRVAAAAGKWHSYKGKRFGDTWIAVVYLWAVLHDRPTVWACDADNWPAEMRWHPLPSQSTMSRRLRTVGVLSLLARCEAQLRDLLPRGPSKWLDAKPLPVGGASKDRDARAGRCVRGKARGYKLHAAVDARGGAVDAWALASMADNEKRIAPEVAPAAVRSNAAAGVAVLYVAADNAYDGNDTYDAVAAAAEWAPQLVARARKGAKGAKRSKGPGHRRQSPRRARGAALAGAYDSPLNPLGRRDAQAPPPTFGGQLLQDRNGVERRFGLMGNFGGGLSPLPNWVRTPHRVALWVQAKLLIVMARELEKAASKNKNLRAA
jgi:hypothetical protein